MCSQVPDCPCVPASGRGCQGLTCKACEGDEGDEREEASDMTANGSMQRSQMSWRRDETQRSYFRLLAGPANEYEQTPEQRIDKQEHILRLTEHHQPQEVCDRRKP